MPNPSTRQVDIVPVPVMTDGQTMVSDDTTNFWSSLQPTERKSGLAGSTQASKSHCLRQNMGKNFLLLSNKPKGCNALTGDNAKSHLMRNLCLRQLWTYMEIWPSSIPIIAMSECPTVTTSEIDKLVLTREFNKDFSSSMTNFGVWYRYFDMDVLSYNIRHDNLFTYHHHRLLCIDRG